MKSPLFSILQVALATGVLFFTTTVHSRPLEDWERALKNWDNCAKQVKPSADTRALVDLGFEAALSEQCGDRPVDEKGTASGVGVHPHDLVRSKTWKEKFTRITNTEYQAFVDRLVVASKTELTKGWITGQGQAPHQGGRQSAAFAINTKTGQVYAAMIKDDDDLAGFGFGADWTKAPKFLKIWAKENGFNKN